MMSMVEDEARGAINKPKRIKKRRELQTRKK